MQSVNPKFIVALVAVLVFVGVLKLVNPHKKYSTREYWVSATLESVYEVPEEALRPGNKNGPVLMWAAAATDNPAIIAALVERGADVNESDPFFAGTPLTGAATFSKTPTIIDALIRLGADVNKEVLNGEDALMVAARYNGNPGIVTRLLFHGANPKRKNHENKTALQLAILSQNSVAEDELRH